MMDRAKDSLAVVRELAQEVDDGPRALGVKTGRRLIEEEQELGL